MTRSEGFTLIEVIVAVAVVSIGVFALLQVMGNGLRASSVAEQIRLATSVAESELDYRQQKNINLMGTLACATEVPDGFACQVVITPCTLVSGEYSCTSGLAVDDTVAYRVDVTATSPRGQDTSLAVYLAKQLQAVGTDGS